MTNTVVHLTKTMFSEKERILAEHGTLKASGFRFDSGVDAVRIENSHGNLILLPFQGQQIWSAAFKGRNLTMRSMFDQPRATRTYLETYGGFLLHCGATAMGVPGPSDNHPLHGELPNAPYQEAFLILGEDSQGAFIALGGKYQHTVAFNYNYTAEPLVTLYENATTFKVEMLITNLKNTSMPLMYLCHANFCPVDNGHLVYTAITDSKHVRVRTSIPSHIHPLPGYKEFLEQLQAQPQKHHDLLPGLGFDPEVVFYIDYLADEQGWAHTMQIHPDGSADYIRHKPSQLRKGVRWISRTPDQDAIGLVLPATAEPEGFLAEEAKGNVQQLGPKERFYLEMEMGYLAPDRAGPLAIWIENFISHQEN